MYLDCIKVFIIWIYHQWKILYNRLSDDVREFIKYNKISEYEYNKDVELSGSKNKPTENCEVQHSTGNSSNSEESYTSISDEQSYASPGDVTCFEELDWLFIQILYFL